MDAVLVTAAKAVTAQLTGHDFGVTFTPNRYYGERDLQLTDAGTLTVDVVPSLYAKNEMDTRRSIMYQPQIDVGIRKKFGSTDITGKFINVSAIDALVLLTEQIYEFFVRERLHDDNDAAWISCEIRSCPVRAHLREWGQFTGIIRMTFDARKDLST